MKCSHCHEQLVKSRDGVTKLRTKVLLFKGQKAFAVCRECSEEIELPNELFKSLFQEPIRHVVKIDKGE